MSAEKDPEYLLGDTKQEVERLRRQHAWIQKILDNKIVFAPVDLQKPGLKILDVGCADGTLLRDLQKQVSPSAELLGVDIMKGFLPTEPQGNISYGYGDVCKPPETEREAAFDFTHLRYVLAGTATYGIDGAVANLAATVAPGGWLQVQEMIYEDKSDPNQPTAWNDVNLIFRTIFEKVGVGNFARGLEDSFKRAGLVNVKALPIQMPIGKKLGDEAAALDSLYPWKITIPTLVAAVKGLADLPGATFDKLPERWEKDMMEHGAVFNAVIVYGQKPTS